MQLLPMASSSDGLISARYAVITKTPGWEVLGEGGGGVRTASAAMPPPTVGRNGEERGSMPPRLSECVGRHSRAGRGATEGWRLQDIRPHNARHVAMITDLRN